MPSPNDPDQIADLRAKLEEAERQLDLVESFLNSLPDFFYVHNWNLEFQYANRASHALWNLPDGALIGKRYNQIDPDPVQSQRIIDICREVMLAGEIRRVEGFPFTMPDGTPRILTQYNVPFKHSKTGEPMLLGMARDSTAEHDLIQERLRRQTLERDLQIAQSIQRSILPTVPPKAQSFEVAARMLPSAYASGDFFDWWPSPAASAASPSATLVCLGDVTGHGIGPALLAAATRAYCRALLQAGTAFEQSLSRLSQVVSADMTAGRFVTLATAALHDDGATVQLLSAGHGPILIHSPHTRSVDELPTHGLPLGIDDEGRFDPHTRINLRPGERIFLLSDGISESANASRHMLGTDAVKAAIAAMPHDLPAELACEQLIKLAQAHSGREQPADDMTVLAIRRRS
jgi:serine phosphatase RsbU (regulator of sigma subunit)